VRDELGRRRLLDFAQLVNPQFQAPAHVRYLADLLERVAQGEIPRLAISAPPGHGKSVLLQNFVAWFLGREPHSRILTISASESLAKRNSRDTQTLFSSDNFPFEVTLSSDSVLEWRTNRGGEVRAIGKGGVVSGFRANGIVVDDLQADAGSETTRASDCEWFQSVLTTRLEPDAWCCLIMTRWNDSDIIGQIRDSEGADQWMFVNLPAISLGEDVDPLHRPEGSALWDQRWPLEKLEAKKAEVGSRVFGALYCGDPVASGGALFKPSWFESRFDTVPRIVRDATPRYSGPYGLRVEDHAITEPPIVIQSCDSAWRDGPQNDRSCIATLATDLKDVYVVDICVGRWQYTDLARIVKENYAKHTPSRLCVEEAASGFAIVDQLRRETGIPVIGVTPGRDSKESRAESCTGFFEASRIKFPRNASWMQELLQEFLRFPHGKHDDIVDAVVLGIRQMQELIQRIQFQAKATQMVSRLGGRSWMSR
ncbi:MAG: phage terminase large subunit, partial [Candidatus Cybelea sp.]